MPKQRTFISFALPPGITDSIFEFRSRIEPYFKEARWESGAKLHSTIRFLGPTDDSIIPAVLDLLRSTAAATGKFPVTVSGFGAFPSMHRPRVLWIGCQSPDGRLSKFHGGIENGLETFGYKRDDRPFHPHITIGRIREKGSVSHLTSLPKNLTFDPRHTVVGEIFLMKSELMPGGSVYTVLGSATLG